MAKQMYLGRKPESLVELKENFCVCSLGHSEYRSQMQYPIHHFHTVNSISLPVRKGRFEDNIRVLQDADAEGAQYVVSGDRHATGRVHRNVVVAILD